MNRYLLSIAICGVILNVGHAAFAASPPRGVTQAAPSSTTVPPQRPQAAGIAEINAAIELGRLNAGNGSPAALEQAASNSAVGAIVTYENQMNAAIALTDPTERDAAITAARRRLGLAGNKQLTPSAITRIDAMLGIGGASSTLGTTP